MSHARAKTFTALAGLIVIIDWTLKTYAINRLPQAGSRSRLISFILHKNPGMSFDIPISIWIIAPLTVCVCVWLLWISHKHWQHNTTISTAANVVVIGAIGNLADRLINGFTTDYILLFGRSAINLADILIITGILALLWYTRDTRTI